MAKNNSITFDAVALALRELRQELLSYTDQSVTHATRDVRTHFSTTADDLGEQRKALDGLREQFDALNASVETLREDTPEFVKRGSLLALRNDLSHRFEAFGDSVEQALGAGSADTKALREQLQQTKVAIDAALKQQAEALAQQDVALKQQSDAIKSEIDARISDLDAALSASQEQQTNTEAHLGALKADTEARFDEFDGRLDDVRRRALQIDDSLKANLDTLKANLDTALTEARQEAAKEATALNACLSEDINAIHKTLDELRAANAAQPSHDHLSALEQRLGAQLVQLKDQLSEQYARKAEIDAHRRDATQALEGAFAALSERVEAAEGTYGALTAGVGDRFADAEHDIRSLQERLGGFISEHGDAVKQLAAQQREQSVHAEALSESVDATFDDIKRCITQLMERDGASEQRSAETTQRIDEQLNALSQTLSDVEQQHADQTKVFRAALDDVVYQDALDALTRTLDETLAHTEQRAAELEQRLDGHTESLTETRALLDATQRDVEAYRGDHEALSEEFARAEERLDTRIDLHAEDTGKDIAALHNRSDEAWKGIGETREELSHATRRLDALGEQHDALSERHTATAERVDEVQRAFDLQQEAVVGREHALRDEITEVRETLRRDIGDVRTSITAEQAVLEEALGQHRTHTEERVRALSEAQGALRQRLDESVSEIEVARENAEQAVQQRIAALSERLVEAGQAFQAEVAALKVDAAGASEQTVSRLAALDKDLEALRRETESLYGITDEIDEQFKAVEERFEQVEYRGDAISTSLALQRDELIARMDKQLTERQGLIAKSLSEEQRVLHEARGRDLKGLVSEAVEEIRVRARGERGPEGYLRTVRTYVEKDQYEERELVRHRNGLWQARCATRTTPSAESDDWLLLAEGIAGIQVQSAAPHSHQIELALSSGETHRLSIDVPRLNDCGTYNKQRAYVAGDSVLWNDVRWVAKGATEGEPGKCDDWYVEAMRGPRGCVGEKGERGLRGEQGERGERGEQGATPSAEAVAKAFEELLVEQQGYAVTLFRGDWTFGAEYRVGHLVGFGRGLFLCTVAHRAEMPPLSVGVANGQQGYWTLVVAPSGNGSVSNTYTSSATVSLVAAEAISAFDVVALNADGQAVKADSSTVSTVSVRGVAAEEAAIGETFVLQSEAFTYAAGGLVAGQSLFVGSEGALSTAAPSSGWLRQVAVALDADTVVVDLGPAYFLGAA